MAEDNVVYVGNKPLMNYVLAVVKEFSGGAQEVTIKARGKTISRAVDAAEVSRNRFVTGAKVKEIRIGTEKITNEGGEFGVSTIEIVMGK
ncbi:MAG TPA: DNA-binding protein Alba [Candidatus Methanoperedens sp.]